MKNYVNYIRESNKGEVIRACIETETYKPLTLFKNEEIIDYLNDYFFLLPPSKVKKALINFNIKNKKINEVYNIMDDINKIEFVDAGIFRSKYKILNKNKEVIYIFRQNSNQLNFSGERIYNRLRKYFNGENNYDNIISLIKECLKEKLSDIGVNSLTKILPMG